MAAVSRAQRPASGVDDTRLSWLGVEGGVLRDASGSALRLLGLRLAASTAPDELAQADTLLDGIAPGQRCLALELSLVAEASPRALAALDERISQWAERGIYTLLRMHARLWSNGHHVRLARRYAGQPAVLYALTGRLPLASRLWAAAQALREAHPRALVWLPLEAMHAAPRGASAAGVGLLWDAAQPQSPPRDALAGGLRQPLLLDGWAPSAHHPMAHDRLMALCRQGNVGWLARCAPGWFEPARGRALPVPVRAVHALQHAVHLSGAAAP